MVRLLGPKFTEHKPMADAKIFSMSPSLAAQLANQGPP